MKRSGFVAGLLALSILTAMVFTGCDAPFINPEAESSETKTEAVDTSVVSEGDELSTEDSEANLEVYVSSVEEFVDSITSGATIHLAPGIYNVTDTLTMSSLIEDELSNMTDEYVGSVNVYDGYQLTIANVNDLTIVCDDYMNPAEIVCEPRYADVVYFLNCENILISNVVMGHTVEKGSCCGSVLAFDQCKNINLGSLDLYGCGTYGLEAYDCENLTAKKVKIHDCSYGLVEIYRTKNVTFDQCMLSYKEGYAQLEIYTSQVTFTDCDFVDIESYSTFLDCDAASIVTFQNCSLSATDVATIGYFAADNVLVIQ